MTAIISTAYSRDLGDELRSLREAATSLGGRAMAVKLGWDPSKVSNIETGKVRPTEIDLAQYLAVCDKGLDYLQDFANRYRHAFDLYFVQTPDNLRTLAMVESMAKKMFVYEILSIPGLLQTEAFMRAMFLDSGLTPQDVGTGVERRMGRQSIWQRPYRPHTVFYVHELALQWRIGDAKIMEDQYLRLIYNAGIVRVVPAHIRGEAFQSKCSVFEFDKAAPLAYMETGLAKVFAQDAAALTWSRTLFERLDEVALSEEQSKAKLVEYISGLREDLHDWRTDLA
ncbi:helix-turn-helix domain-containing protein [Lentzea sp. CA-135723]|uniref:helix-turn-helix domain-containing protein n=1 Tax=Lentzea sp. CA-135723 TaxID=3239950 RepID=UPI003D8E6214